MNSAQYLREMYASVYNHQIDEAKKDEDEKEYEGYGKSSKFKQDTDAKSFRPGKDVPKVKKFGRISRAMPASISGHATRTISANTTAAGGDPGAPRSQKIAGTKKMVKRDGKWVKSEGTDLFDIVMGHLLDEGFASTEEAAVAIMSNMSEEWVDSIVAEYIEE
jgi:hypothetical protein